MKYKLLTIILTFLICITFTVSTNAQTISTLSIGTLSVTPRSALIELEITAADQNQTKLQNQFKIFLDNFQSELINNSPLTNNNFKRKKLEQSSSEKETGYNNPLVYQQQLTIQLILSAKKPDLIAEKIESIIDLIEDNKLSQQNSGYNSLSRLELNYEQAYYYFKNKNSLQQQLLNDSLSKNKSKAINLAQLIAESNPNLIEIKEIKSANIANYKEKINLKQPQPPQEIELKNKIRVFYSLN